jgi:hypothetical protein
MANPRSVFLAALALLCTSCGTAGAQNVDISSTSGKQRVVSLNSKNSGQRLSATVGQQIEISLGAMAACDPQVSSAAIRLESIALPWPPTPGITTHIYIFEAAAEGEAEVKIPITDCSNQDLKEGLTFALTIRVARAAPGESTTPYASRRLDQANNALWDKAWTNLLNDVRQTFTPSLPTLTAVEVEFTVGNPGQPSAEVTMNLADAEGRLLAVVSKTVPVNDCQHVLFILPDGGLEVSPGQAYSIRLSSGSVFGWKYVVGGYPNGAALFNGKPLLPGTRSTFLFRTFGAS